MQKPTPITVPQVAASAGAPRGPVELDASLFAWVAGGNPRSGGWSVDNPRSGGWNATAGSSTSSDNPRSGGW